MMRQQYIVIVSTLLSLILIEESCTAFVHCPYYSRLGLDDALSLKYSSSVTYRRFHSSTLTTNNKSHHICDKIFRCSGTTLFAKSGKRKKKDKGNGITENRLAYRNYDILETLEAGISLKGTEVKSIRDGKMNIRDGYCKVTKTGQCTLHNVHIGKHSQSGAYFQHEERRVRPMLIHKGEARKFALKTENPGITVVPLKAYFNDNNRVKFIIGLAKGKNVRDKRQDIKAREEKRDIGRMMKNFRV